MTEWSIHCETCGSEKQYSHAFDTYYCESCDRWLEERCDDPDCRYCPKRPEKPSAGISQ